MPTLVGRQFRVEAGCHEWALSHSYHCVLTVLQSSQSVHTGRVDSGNTWSADEHTVKFITGTGVGTVHIAVEGPVMELYLPLKTADLPTIDVPSGLNVKTTDL